MIGTIQECQEMAHASNENGDSNRPLAFTKRVAPSVDMKLSTNALATKTATATKETPDAD